MTRHIKGADLPEFDAAPYLDNEPVALRSADLAAPMPGLAADRGAAHELRRAVATPFKRPLIPAAMSDIGMAVTFSCSGKR